MTQEPLRYHISNWHQLPRCLSNNSRNLKICVTDFIQNSEIQGLRISVEHLRFGTLFATVVNPKGSIVSKEYTDDIYTMTDEDILNALAMYGFLIVFCPRKHLSDSQLAYLQTLKGLHFDKLRRLPVWNTVRNNKVFQVVTVAFKIEAHSDWINNEYAPSQDELNAGLIAGTAINISAISAEQCFDWSWLDYVANIDDILEDNAHESDDSSV